MNNSTVYNAICEIDEDLLNEYDMNIVLIKKRTKTAKRIITCSVCFAVIITAGITLSKNGVFSTDIITSEKNSILTAPDIKNGNTTTATNRPEKTTAQTDKTNKNKKNDTQKKTDTPEKTTAGTTTVNSNSTEGIKGGDTSEFIRRNSLGPDGISYYRVFFPNEDVFDPTDNMTIENRFCSFTFNGKSYYPAPDGDISSEDYEHEKLDSTIASHFELRAPDEEVVGIEYRARVDIYKLKNISPDEAVACVISFNGETKEYKYNATEITPPSYP